MLQESSSSGLRYEGLSVKAGAGLDVVDRASRKGGSMKEEQHQFLRLLGQLPARLTAEQAAWVLNCQVHDIPILVGARLLKPLGNPQKNGIKFFATSELLELVKDKAWLVKVT